MKKFFKKYYIEICLVIVAIVGLIFLLGDFGFLQNIRRELGGLLGEFFRFVRITFRTSIQQLLRLSGSDALILVVVIGSIGLVLYRIRYRYRHDPNNVAENCPRCDSQLKRTRRSFSDRLLSKTIKPHARRYTCSNPYCRWSGLRRYVYTQPKLPTVESDQEAENELLQSN